MTLEEINLLNKGIFLQQSFKITTKFSLFRVLPKYQEYFFHVFNCQTSDDDAVSFRDSFQLVDVRDSDSEEEVHEDQSHGDEEDEEECLGKESSFWIPRE